MLSKNYYMHIVIPHTDGWKETLKKVCIAKTTTYSPCISYVDRWEESEKVCLTKTTTYSPCIYRKNALII